MDNGTFTGTKTLDTWAKTLRTDRRRDGWYRTGNEDTETAGRADDVDGGQPKSDTLRDYWEDYGYSS